NILRMRYYGNAPTQSVVIGKSVIPKKRRIKQVIVIRLTTYLSFPNGRHKKVSSRVWEAVRASVGLSDQLLCGAWILISAAPGIHGDSARALKFARSATQLGGR